jgi:CubicO group peptidase (beta-lactamase class C family)
MTTTFDRSLSKLCTTPCGLRWLALCRASLTISVGLVGLLQGFALARNLPEQDGVAAAPDRNLLIERGQPWWYRSQPSPSPTSLNAVPPGAEEQALIDRARRIFAAQPAKVMALIDGERVLHTEFKSPATPQSLVFGYSIGKTVTAMAVGKAICAGHLQFDTKAAAQIPELSQTALGAATVRDLLRMASGTRGPNADSTIFTPDQYKLAATGQLDLIAALSEDRVAGAARGVFSDYKPGEQFSYKSTDPMVLGVMVARALKMPFNQWVQEQVLNPMGAAHPGVLMQDRQQYAASAGGVALRLEDWIRFALWVKRSSREAGCFGDFVRAAMRTQITNPGTPASRKFGASFNGYGYFMWADNATAPESVWALGYGGQRIGWSNATNNNRMIVVFSNVESWMPDVYTLGRDWQRLSK